MLLTASISQWTLLGEPNSRVHDCRAGECLEFSGRLVSYNPDNEGLTDTNGIPAKRMYVLGQYSRFVRPGYYRIGVREPMANTSISAYKDPNSGRLCHRGHQQ